MPGDAWHPQFGHALDFAREVRDTYATQGYRIEVVGHGTGGAHAQVIAQTFGWGGRSFDAPGAANIIDSNGYRGWLAENGVTPAGMAGFRPDPLDSGFLNYKVNNSAISQKSGPHLGDAQSISSLEGRTTPESRARYVAGLAGGAVDGTPLLGETLRAAKAGRVLQAVEGPAPLVHHGLDAADRHDKDRIVSVFEEAVRRQERDDARPLPMFGEHGRREAPPPLAQQPPEAGRAPDADASQCERDAVRSLLEGGPESGVQRLLDAARQGDAGAVDRALREMTGGAAGQAWLQSGLDRLPDEPQREGPASGQERQAQQHAVLERADPAQLR
ncbi:hypothetical protein IB242_01180 [Xanthomonas sp. XNM01]|nr:hypothetical protein [Xanthomonas sp. XNM01]